MEFRQLQSFAAVVQYGSFTKAAERLYLSQPTVSAHVRMLEEKLGQQLILRTTKSVRVTQKGEEVYGYVTRILNLWKRMEQACCGEGRNIIQIGASTIPSAYILPEILPEFGQLFPDVYFVIHQNDSQGIADGLTEGLFDIGMTGMSVENSALVFQPFFHDKMVLITPVTERFLEMQDCPHTPLDLLLKEPVILREEGSGSQKSANRYLESRGVSEADLNVTARINDQEAIKNLVAGGLGISFISEKAAANFVREKRLLQFELPESQGRQLYLAWCRNNRPSGAVRSFKTFVLKKYLNRVSEVEG